MQTQIGSDECILLLLKNNKVPNVPNNLLDRRIDSFVCYKLGVKVKTKDVLSFWETNGNSKNIGKYNLPMTEWQYELSYIHLSELYKETNS